MMKISFLFRAIVLLAVIASTNVSAENYIIQPGDKLSYIAEKKILTSGLPLNLEQVMLTIFQLNPSVFIGGDIDRLIPAKNMYIPDTAADFLPMTKTEAQQHLSDKDYLRRLYLTAKNSASTVMARSNAASNNVRVQNNASKHSVTQILQTLENHQQAIDRLKNENDRLSNNFKLLERAFGRLVLVQGLLTDEVVKVKSTLFKNLPYEATKHLENSRPAGTSPVALNDTTPTAFSFVINQMTEMLSSKKPVDNTIVSNSSEASMDKRVSRSDINFNQKNQNDYYRLKIILPVIVLMALLFVMLWIFDFRRIRSKLRRG